MSHLQLLLRKELWVLRNSYWRTRKQAAATLGVLLLLLLAAAGIAGASHSWLRPLLAQVPPSVRGALVAPLLLVLLAWLGLLFFASTAQESRNRFFLTPDLSLLVSTPVNPLLLFSVRFVLFICLSPASLLPLFLFGIGPLIGLGLIVGAPWYYYPLVAPIAYLYVLVPAALGVAAIMLLLRVFSPQRLFQVAAIGSAIMGGTWLVFVFGDQTAILIRLLGAAEWVGPAWRAVLPLHAAAGLLTALLGYGTGALGHLAALVGSAALVFLVGMLVVGWAYYRNYERLQVGQWRPAAAIAARQATAGARRGRPPGSLWLLVLGQWKMAWRNREVAQGALGIGFGLVGYVIIVSQLGSGAEPLLALAHVAVISFMCNLVVQIMFVPFAMISDPSVVCKQYWPLKTAPVPGRLVVYSLMLAQCLPALFLALLALIAANVAQGAAPTDVALSLGLMLFVLPSSAGIFQLTSLLGSSAVGRQAPLLARMVRDLAPVLYGALVLLPAAVGYGYQRVAALSFMHAWPRELVLPLSVLLTVLLAVVALTQSLRLMNLTWQALEIS